MKKGQKESTTQYELFLSTANTTLAWKHDKKYTKSTQEGRGASKQGLDRVGGGCTPHEAALAVVVLQGIYGGDQQYIGEGRHGNEGNNNHSMSEQSKVGASSHYNQ